MTMELDPSKRRGTLIETLPFDENIENYLHNKNKEGLISEFNVNDLKDILSRIYKVVADENKINEDVEPNEREVYIRTHDLVSDCEVLEMLQTKLYNTTLVFSNGNSCVPFFHLYGNNEEGFAVQLKHRRESLTEEEYNESKSFTLDEKVCTLISSFEKVLEEAGYGKTKNSKFVILYGGSYYSNRKYQLADPITFLAVEPKVENKTFGITHYINVIEIKL